jgi:hypothetical protein
MRRMAFALCTLLLLWGATAVSAEDISGTIVRIDQPARVIVFDDGRMWRMTNESVLLVDNQPVQIVSLEPGTRVVLRAWEPVMVREGHYIVVTEPAAAVTPAPAPAAPVVSQTTVTTTTTTTTTAPAAPPLTAASGTVSKIDVPAGVIVFTDGRMLRMTPKSVILWNGQPVAYGELRPGMTVDIRDSNPVVYRDGRYVLFNTGYRDPETGSSLTWDSTYAGYEADIDHAGMQVQFGG